MRRAEELSCVTPLRANPVRRPDDTSERRAVPCGLGHVRENWVSPERGHAREFFGPPHSSSTGPPPGPRARRAPAVSTPWGGVWPPAGSAGSVLGFGIHRPLLGRCCSGELPGSLWVRAGSAASAASRHFFRRDQPVNLGIVWQVSTELFGRFRSRDEGFRWLLLRLHR